MYQERVRLLHAREEACEQVGCRSRLVGVHARARLLCSFLLALGAGALALAAAVLLALAAQQKLVRLLQKLEVLLGLLLGALAVPVRMPLEAHLPQLLVQHGLVPGARGIHLERIQALLALLLLSRVSHCSAFFFPHCWRTLVSLEISRVGYSSLVYFFFWAKKRSRPPFCPSCRTYGRRVFFNCKKGQEGVGSAFAWCLFFSVR